MLAPRSGGDSPRGEAERGSAGSKCSVERTTRSGLVYEQSLSSSAVQKLPGGVGMARVTGCLADQVEKDPAEASPARWDSHLGSSTLGRSPSCYGRTDPLIHAPSSAPVRPMQPHHLSPAPFCSTRSRKSLRTCTYPSVSSTCAIWELLSNSTHCEPFMAA